MNRTIQAVATPTAVLRVVVSGPALSTEAINLRLRDMLTELKYKRGAFAYLVLFPGRGTSMAAADWAQDAGVSYQLAFIDREKFARAADRIGNTQVLQRYAPHFVVAIPGDALTDDLVAKAKLMNIEVVELAAA